MTGKKVALPWLLMSLCLLLGFALAEFFPLPFMKKAGLTLTAEKKAEGFFMVNNDIELLKTDASGKAVRTKLAKGTIVKVTEDGSVTVVSPATGSGKP